VVLQVYTVCSGAAHDLHRGALCLEDHLCSAVIRVAGAALSTPPERCCRQASPTRPQTHHLDRCTLASHGRDCVRCFWTAQMVCGAGLV
jgi:hypothetical protein